MSYHSYGSSPSSTFRRQVLPSLSSSLYLSTRSPLLYRPSTYSTNYSLPSSTYRRSVYSSSGAPNSRSRYEGSLEDLPSDKDSVTAKVDSPSALRKGSSTRSFGSVTTCDDIDKPERDDLSGEDLTTENYYKRLYEEATSQRESEEAALVAELKEQIDLRQKLIYAINNLQALQHDLNDTSEMCILLEVSCVVQMYYRCWYAALINPCTIHPLAVLPYVRLSIEVRSQYQKELQEDLSR
ncbi:uncharacterized protein LOC111250637 isoform X2 [Varroa destructor]|uniref:Uncharacterized protein n=1 Tax=Varroa destructor TaxID=109461 RepID=A0A7M7K588_VARDE|nr:uncharacterized protein LOC111250637 isoform X2 [Varroa destructor]